MNERFHALVFSIFFCLFCFVFPDDKRLKINIERKEEEEEEKKTNMRVIIFPCFKKEKKNEENLLSKRDGSPLQCKDESRERKICDCEMACTLSSIQHYTWE
jgi:hypothetical protein